MSPQELKSFIRNYIKENLSINTRRESVSYGSKSYTVIELKLDDETISETYLDD